MVIPEQLTDAAVGQLLQDLVLCVMEERAWGDAVVQLWKPSD